MATTTMTPAMTPGQQNLIRILVRCIEQVGEEFRYQGADERFWREADYVSRLFGLLWTDGYMYENCYGLGQWSDFKVPLVHRELPTRTPSGRKREWYDLALLDGENASKVASDDIPDGKKWIAQMAENREILVAVEVKIGWWDLSNPNNWSTPGGLGPAIVKLISNIKAGQVKQGYILVFCAAKEHAEAGGERPPYPWAKMKGNEPWLREEWSGLPHNVRKNIYIYYVTDHPSDAEHHWIPSRPI